MGVVAVLLLGLVIALPLLRREKVSSESTPSAAPTVTSAPVAVGVPPSSTPGQGAPSPVPTTTAPPSTSPSEPPSPLAAPTRGPATSPGTAPAPGYDSAFRSIVKECDGIDAAASATARSIWHGSPAARAAAAFHQHRKRMATLAARARALKPPPDQAARHQRLLDLLALGVRRTAQLAQAADVEAKSGVEAAKPYWEAEIPTLKAYETARKSL